MIYDALYSWATHLQRLGIPTTWAFIVECLEKFLKRNQDQEIAAWAKELKEIIQDQIDTNLSLSLKVAEALMSISFFSGNLNTLTIFVWNTFGNQLAMDYLDHSRIHWLK
jgi:hypothetical protein